MNKNLHFSVRKQTIVLGLLLCLFFADLKAQCTASFTFIHGADGVMSFTNTSTGANINTVYSWDFGDSSSVSNKINPKHKYFVGGYYLDITLIMSVYSSTNNLLCQDTAKKSIFMFNPSSKYIQADFNFRLPGLGGFVEFEDASNSFEQIVKYEWDFGDSSSKVFSKDTIHRYLWDGTYSVKLKITSLDTINGIYFYDSIIKPLTIYNTSFNDCNAIFTSSLSGQGEAYFVPFGPSSTTIKSYFWDFGDGTSTYHLFPTHNYSSNGSYTVKLVTYNYQSNCKDSTSQVINITTAINSPCSVIPNITHYEFPNPGQKSNTTFSCISNPAYFYKVKWDFGDGGIDSSNGNGLLISHLYSANGLYNVKAYISLASSNCKDTILYPAVINKVGVFDCSSLDTSFSYFNSNLGNVDFSTGYQWSYPTEYFWDFGDGTTLYSNQIIYVSHNYAYSGNYTVKFKVRYIGSNCIDSSSKIINIENATNNNCKLKTDFLHGESNFLNGQVFLLIIVLVQTPQLNTFGI